MDDLLMSISAFGAHRCELEVSLDFSKLIEGGNGDRSYLIFAYPHIIVRSHEEVS